MLITGKFPTTAEPERILWLTIPLGPKVLLTRSPTAIAPTKEDYK